MLPTVHEFYDSDPADNILISLERLLTLAVPNTYFWLLGFYAFFHLTLNLLAEVPRPYLFCCLESTGDSCIKILVVFFVCFVYFTGDLSRLPDL